MWHQSTNRTDQPGDTSDGFEIAGADALALNGSAIMRASTFPFQSANLTFHSGGGSGNNSSGDSDGTLGLYGFRLRGGGDESTDSSDLPPVTVDCSGTPLVLNVTSTAFAGEYGAGQRIYFRVRTYDGAPEGAPGRTTKVFVYLAPSDIGTVFRHLAFHFYPSFWPYSIIFASPSLLQDSHS